MLWPGAARPFLWREKQVRPDERLDELVADACLTTRVLTSASHRISG